MLKRYETNSRLQWVGKAWEIRSAIRRIQREQGGSARLVDVLRPAKERSPAR
ncbi:hypothetical protein [Cohnella fermenti]|uniref:hypothetical protein n=1 Tax=Cohnella fermenti TaxID=2565925 RepID=UPI001454CB70|nr:hypothetical protein [Cohnella fermenti]